MLTKINQYLKLKNQKKDYVYFYSFGADSSYMFYSLSIGGIEYPTVIFKGNCDELEAFLDKELTNGK